MLANIVEVQNLSRRFGTTLALDEVSMQVQPGLVYGLVGANGQGKTTLLKHLLGLLRAQQGSVRVFGQDPVKHPVSVLQRVGYLSEDRDLPEWMRVGELMRYTAAYHPGWHEQYASELLDTFHLDRAKKIKHLSRGMRAQVGLIAAVAHRPDLLLLDEPSTGLDAIVRQDILNLIIRTVAEEGRAVIFSSHLLDEVEKMSDYVFMIEQGKLVLEGDLERILQQHKLLNVHFRDAPEQLPTTAGVLSAERLGRHWRIVCNGQYEQVCNELTTMGGEITDSRPASLQEVFVARVGRDRLIESQV